MKFSGRFKHYLVIVISVMAFVSCSTKETKTTHLVVDYPAAHTVFPPDMAAPTFTWSTNATPVPAFRMIVQNGDVRLFESKPIKETQWRPEPDLWERIKKTGGKELTFTVYSEANDTKGSVPFSITADSVAAPIFYRNVPLPFKFARENLKNVSWHLGHVSDEERPQTVLDNIPVCGNCHSFSADGKTLGMDVDARDEKGAYAIVDLEPEVKMGEDEIINWSQFQKNEFTYGLLSQISPNGRYVVSTLKDCEIFVDRHDLEYSQLFFPFKGILQVYDRQTGRSFELEGANDTTFVQSNPVWSPDGQYLYFARSKAYHFEESGIFRGSKATDYKTYKKFLKNFLERKTLFKFDIYRVPFNDGKGGVCEPVKGASHNGMSNYFPRFTPDGKWMVFCQAESFMLLMPDSKLHIVSAEGGEPRLMNCNTDNMNSWHSISPNGKWMVFSSKANGPFTQLYLTHLNVDGTDTPPVLLERFVAPQRAANIPEFVNLPTGASFKIDPAFLEQDAFTIRMAEIKRSEGALDEALTLFNQAIDENPKNAQAYHGRGETYVLLRKPEVALDDFDKAVYFSGNSSVFHVSRAMVYTSLQKNEKALKDYQRAIELDSFNFMAYNNRGILYWQGGELDKAYQEFSKAIQYNPDAVNAYVNRGAVTVESGMPDLAMQDFNTAIRIHPKDVAALKARAMLREQMNELPTALQDLDLAIQLAPENGELRFRRGLLYQKLGNNEVACNDFTQSAQLGFPLGQQALKKFCK